MKKKHKATILFLTACVNPNGMALTAIQSPDVRLKQYLEAVKYYLAHTPFKILLIDNSSFDFTPYFEEEVKAGRIEILNFNGNCFDKNLGKGYGEGVIIKFAFEHSRFIQEHETVIKITGRHIVTNVIRLMKVATKLNFPFRPFIAANISSKEHIAVSDIFIATKDFFQDFFLKKLGMINDSNGIYFEHVLYESIYRGYLNNFRVICFPIIISQKGFSGSTGKPLNGGQITWKTRIRQILKFLLFASKMGFVISIR